MRSDRGEGRGGPNDRRALRLILAGGVHRRLRKGGEGGDSASGIPRKESRAGIWLDLSSGRHGGSVKRYIRPTSEQSSGSLLDPRCHIRPLELSLLPFLLAIVPRRLRQAPLAPHVLARPEGPPLELASPLLGPSSMLSPLIPARSYSAPPA
jgi:hypothetical protein